MTSLYRCFFTLVLAALILGGCMEPAPLPGWVIDCLDVDDASGCTPSDARTDVQLEAQEIGPE